MNQASRTTSPDRPSPVNRSSPSLMVAVQGEVIGVAQVLNKHKGAFTRGDLKLLVAMTTQGTLALQSAQFIERMKAIRKQELEFLDIVSEVTSDIKIGSLLPKVMGDATRMLNSDRSTLFLNAETANQ